MNGWITTGLALAAAVIASWLTHSYDSAQHEQAVADLRAAAATELADQTATVLHLLQNEIDRSAALETRSVQLSQETERATADGRRLSADLAAARGRVLQLTRAGGGGGGGADGQADARPGACETVRAALARTLAALERLESGGDEAAQLGQDAVDVATLAAEDARSREGRQ